MMNKSGNIIKHMALAEKKNKITVVIISMLSLLAGGIIYLLFRPHTLNMFAWLRLVHADVFFKYHAVGSSPAASFCVYSLPNGLWALSALLMLSVIWGRQKNVYHTYASVFISASIFAEILQGIGIIEGTFDVLDIIPLLISAVIAEAIYTLLIKGESA